MAKSYPIFLLVAILFVDLCTSEMTVTFEPHNETQDTTLYGTNSANLHSIGALQRNNQQDVETFYIPTGVSDGDERRGDFPATYTHSPLTEANEPQAETVPISETVNCPPIQQEQPCPRCCDEAAYPVYRPTYINYPVHPLFPYWGGGASHAPVVEDDAEYINTGNAGGHQVIYVTQPQQPPSFPQFPSFPAFPDSWPQKPTYANPSIVYYPYNTPSTTNIIPGFDNTAIGNNNGVHINSNWGIDDSFTQGSPHRNHEQIWKQHQQQHQAWLQKQRQQYQPSQIGHFIIGGNGIGTFENIGSGGQANLGHKRPCDSK